MLDFIQNDKGQVMKKWVSIATLLLFLVYFASSSAVNEGVVMTKAVLPQNLSSANHQQLILDTNTIYQNTDKNSAYALSIPLLSYGLLVDDQYHSVLAEMQEALKNETSPTFKAWLLGRIISAADSFGDKVTADAAAKEALALITTSPSDEYSAWAWGYVLNHAAISATKQYETYKINMLKNCVKVEISKTTDLSSKLWAWVMCMQASAAAGDSQTYKFAVRSMQELTHTQNLVDALNQIPQGDFRAWAFAIARVASITIVNTTNDGTTQRYLDQYKALAQPTLDAIAVSPKVGDKLLAQANNELSQLRFNSLLIREVPKTPTNMGLVK